MKAQLRSGGAWCAQAGSGYGADTHELQSACWAPLARSIALHRRYLREGVNGGVAVEYLRPIAEAEAELERIGASERC